MTKLIVILLIGLFFESTGIVFLKKGMNQIGEAKTNSVAAVARFIKAAGTNYFIWLGMFFQALFFGCLLILMSESEISFLWPLTALSFVFATFAAMWFLNEQVSLWRWVGVILIVIGAGFISYSEHTKEKPAPPAETNSIQR
ncbi:MAG TPA: EamA family transporter [Methylomirabilota bacterium]|nr:EamA family transporter [Methylomirabilota bacterium]